MGWLKEARSTAARWLDEHSGFSLYAVVLLLAMAAAYELQVGRMGAYYDDWEGLFMYKQGFSALQIWNYFLKDRPFSTLVHVLYNPLIGSSAVGWHILGLLLNWAAILFLVRTLLELWPRRVMEAGWIGLLIALYPGMHRQFVVHTSMPHYTSMLLFTVSLFLMLKAVQQRGKRAWLLLAVSVVLAALQVLIIEYFSMLELLRPLLLYQLFRSTAPDWRAAARRAARVWIPYAFVVLGFLVFHFVILPALQPGGAAPKNNILLFGQLAHDPVGTVVEYVESVVQDVLYSALYVWSTPWTPLDLDLQARSVVFSWALGILVAAACAWMMWSWQKKGQASGPVQPALVGLLCLGALLLGGIPVWILGVKAVKGTWADRYLFGQIMGAVPLFVLGVVWLTGSDRRKAQNLLFAALLAGSVSIQFRVGNRYVVLWDRMRNYYWQLNWRAPSLQPGTFLVTSSTPVGGTDSYQNGLVVNTALNPGYGREEMQYWWFNGPEDLFASSIGKYHPNSAINYSYRSLTFRSDMQHAFPVFSAKSGGRCLQVADPVYQGEPLLNVNDQQLFQIAHPEMVQQKQRLLPQDVFGPEPPHTWCYYFERADLARQFAQWDQVRQLWQQAGDVASTSEYGPEYLPFIEAFARAGDWGKAAELTIQANTRTVEMAPFLCGTWSRIMQDTPASDARSANWLKIKDALACSEAE